MWGRLQADLSRVRYHANDLAHWTVVAAVVESLAERVLPRPEGGRGPLIDHGNRTGSDPDRRIVARGEE